MMESGIKISRSKVLIIIFIAIAIFITVLIAVFIHSVYIEKVYVKGESPYAKMENYYYSESENFNELVSFFKNIYTKNVEQAYLDIDGTLVVDYSDGKRGREEKEVSDKDAFFALTALKNKAENSFFVYGGKPRADYIIAYYDANGNMGLRMRVCVKEINIGKKGRGGEIPDILCYYLVYIDDEYNKTYWNKWIRDVGEYGEPFVDNWYTWSERTYTS